MMWSLILVSGITWSHTLLSDTGSGQKPEVVPGEKPQSWTFHHDNLFDSLAPLDDVTKRGLGVFGDNEDKPSL